MRSFWARLTRQEKSLHYVVTMRVLGGILLFLGTAEMSLGLYIFSFFKNVHLGCWWGAICVIISGLLGIASNNRSVVMGGCAVSSLGLITAAVAVVLDGLSVSVFKGLVACINTDTRYYSGDESAMKEIKACARDYMGKPSNSHHHVFSHVTSNRTVGPPGPPPGPPPRPEPYYYNNFYNYFYPYYYISRGNPTNGSHYDDDFFYFFDDDFIVGNPGHNYYNNNHNGRQNDDDYVVQPACVCTDNEACYDYTLSHGDDCGSILTTYTDDLVSSTSLLAACFFVLLIYCVVAFSSACYSEYKVAASDSDDIQLSNLRQQDDSSPPTPAEIYVRRQQQRSSAGSSGGGSAGNGMRYAVPIMVQHSPPPGVVPPGSRSPQTPQYVQMGTTDRPVYILQMYAPAPGQEPANLPVFLDSPQFVAMSSDSHMYLSKESSFHTGGMG